MGAKVAKTFVKHSMVLNTVTGAALFLVGDTIEQQLEINRGDITNFDFARLARITAVGALEGPPHVIFYTYLDKILPGNSARTIGRKILADQLIACPFFNLQFFYGMGLLEGKSLDECTAEFKRKFPFVYAVDWMIWPGCQAINFLFVPPAYRVLYVNTATVFWNVFLSYMKHYDQ